ncbi:MAG: BACON domain-containing protein [Prevotella sp.]|nr:BACON domain-containing protein [Prevotella sp.]
MRKYYYIYVMAAALLATACSSDDELKGYVPQSSTIEVVQNDLYFPAQGSTATVEVGTDVTASVDVSWCTATVSGRVVTVSVEPNTSFEGRTALLTLTSGDVSRRLPVQQLGMVLATLPANNRYAPMQGDEFSYPMRHDLPMTASANQPWLHATVTDDELQVVVDANDEGHIRRGRIVVESAGYSDTLAIAQYDLYDDIVGSYYILGYYGGNSEQPAATRFDVVERNDSLFMHWTTESGRYNNSYIYVPFDRATATLNFTSNFTLYEQGSTRDAGFFYDRDGHICTSQFSGASCYMYYSELQGYNAAQISPYNWPGHQIWGFIIRSSSLVSTTIIQLSNIVIMRVGPEGTRL